MVNVTNDFSFFDSHFSLCDLYNYFLLIVLVFIIIICVVKNLHSLFSILFQGGVYSPELFQSIFRECIIEIILVRVKYLRCDIFLKGIFDKSSIYLIYFKPNLNCSTLGRDWLIFLRAATEILVMNCLTIF